MFMLHEEAMIAMNILYTPMVHTSWVRKDTIVLCSMKGSTNLLHLKAQVFKSMFMYVFL